MAHLISTQGEKLELVRKNERQMSDHLRWPCRRRRSLGETASLAYSYVFKKKTKDSTAVCYI